MPQPLANAYVGIECLVDRRSCRAARLVAFIDWNEPLEKQIAMQGIFIYSYKRLKELAAIMEDSKLVGELGDKIQTLEQYALTSYYNEEKGLFVDPTSGQIAIPSQTWMLLAEIGDAELRKNVLENLLALDDERGCRMQLALYVPSLCGSSVAGRLPRRSHPHHQTILGRYGRKRRRHLLGSLLSRGSNILSVRR